jgi:hypothetical protein
MSHHNYEEHKSRSTGYDCIRVAQWSYTLSRTGRDIMSHKESSPSNAKPNKNLKEDGITNPKDGRGPLRRSDDSSTKLPLQTDARTPRTH